MFIRKYNLFVSFAFLILIVSLPGTNSRYNVNATEQVSSSNASESRVNVKDLGAIAGDGINDQPALQTAINTADREELTTIYIPEGIYDIFSYLTLEDNIVIEGDGQNASVLEGPMDKRNDIIRADNKSNIGIMNLAIRGFGVDMSADCIHFENVSDYTISNTTLSGCGSGTHGAAILASNTSDGRVIHNTILSSRNGYYTYQGGGSKNVFIGYNTIINSTDDAIHPQTGSNNVIVGNIVRDSGDDNIDLWEENNALIENNTIVMNVMGGKIIDGIEIGNGSTDVVAKKNQIVGPAGRGVMVTSLGRDGGTNANITIIDNDFGYLHYGCMLIQDAGGASINGVTIHHNQLSNC